MANSLSFNSTDLSTYGLRVMNFDDVFSQLVEYEQLLNRGYGTAALRPPKPLDFEISISAANLATLLGYLDSIKGVLNERESCSLTIDGISDRYWLVRYVSLVGRISGGKLWSGSLSFTAIDPVAYDNNETSDGPHTIDDDPEEDTFTVAGTARTYPVFTLTADSTQTDTTVEIENEATGETIEWTGDLVNTDVLEIDTANGTVTLNSVADMLEVDGEFPTFLPGTNIVNTSGFAGVMTVTYRKRYI